MLSSACNDHCFLQYVMINGKFDQPDDLPGRQMVEGKYTLAPLYHVKVREGIKKSIFLGNSPKQRTPPTHRISLGLT